MTLNKEYVAQLFSNLERGNGDGFFACVADNVKWTVMGTHPLAGAYTSQSEFRRGTFERLSKVLKDGVVWLHVEHILVSGDYAVVEMTSTSVAHNGRPYNNQYCWVLRFDGGVVAEVRAYLDSFLVKQILDENE